MTTPFFDADAFSAEVQAKGLPVRFAGKTWEVPASPPADVWSDLLRGARVAARVGAEGGEPTPDEIAELTDLDDERMLEGLIGAENLAAWYSEGIDNETLYELVYRLVQHHAERQRGADRGNRETRRATAGKRTPAAASSRSRSTRSSSGGASSKRTSAGSTRSGS